MIPTLETIRLSLRPLTINDFANFYEYAQDPAVSGPGMWLPYPSEAEAQKDFERILSAYTRNLMWWALEDHGTGKMIGRCQLSDYDPEDAHAELSYALHRNFWGQGLMSEAARAVLGYGFEFLKLNRVGAQVFVDNQGSIRMLEKLGMVMEGCLRHYRQVRGKPEDVFVYSLLRAEWHT
jgi:ribosomal-protein-alanine N-acetyltransferase